MKIVYLECSAEELKANRGIMDSIVDAVSDIFGGFYGNCVPTESEEPEDVTEEDEEE